MEFDMFPPIKSQKLKEIMESRINAEEAECLRVVGQLQKKIPPESNVVIGLMCGFFGGITVWFCRCFNLMCSCKEEAFLWDGSLGSLIAYALVGGVFGLLVHLLIIEKVKKKTKNLREKCDIEWNHFYEKRRNITDEYNKIENDYRNKFEQEAKNVSIKFSTSSLTKQVTNEIVPYFEEVINKADRRRYIERIEILQWIRIYSNRIDFSAAEGSRTMDFEVNRYSVLKSKVEQAALARAIAINVQLELTQIFTRDPSGTPDPRFEISYNYEMDCAMVQIQYIAANGNFEMKQSW